MPASDAELIQRARDIAPRIKARAAQTAELRRPHDDSIRDMVDAELIQMFVPRRWGGSEASLSTMMEVVELIAAACPSTGWIAAFYIAHNTYVAKFPEATQELLFGPRGYVLLPAAGAPDMEARKVDGGWEVSGRAAWGSGIMHADWVQMSGKAGDGNRSFLMPVSDVEVIDTWHYTGMAGTGSADYVARKVFVPDDRAVSAADFYAGPTEGSRIHANPHYSIPFLLSAYCTILPVLTGTLLGALHAFEEIADKRVRNFSGAARPADGPRDAGRNADRHPRGPRTGPQRLSPRRGRTAQAGLHRGGPAGGQGAGGVYLQAVPRHGQRDDGRFGRVKLSRRSADPADLARSQHGGQPCLLGLGRDGRTDRAAPLRPALHQSAGLSCAARRAGG